ncbi:hypothetical protein C7974DRAFT_29445 [Boeremia exigua]|uniref:uncharacterized protein n=1 Tax=Boeremia exigua TaxID=749465 RepID=UPI001E8CBF0A|nr:uncharacterized protein C7974DRAFT_29445 [Boeremia exigua]KAH6644877.1 hypothetical protein C7974DRAFT_29445 [Boeremia exigua]
MTYDVRKGGIPALAYPRTDPALPVSLSLIIKCHDHRAQVTLCLQSAVPVQGSDQTVILQYDADNIVPGAISVGPAAIPLPQDRLDALARAGNPQMRTLSLKLKKTCPVWLQSTPLTPRPGSEAPFHQLAKLARATEVEILFDNNWLHRGVTAGFQRLVGHPEELTGFPVDQHYRQQQYKLVDWRAFNIADTRDVTATVEGELPPAYAEGSNKRPRHVATPTPSSPPPKRVLLSPFAGVHASPTERDSTSPTPPNSTIPSPHFSPLAALHSVPHTPIADAVASPTAPSSDIHTAVENALTALLPSLLPTILQRLLTSTPSPTPSLSSQTSHAAPPPRLTALGVSLHDRLAGELSSEVAYIYNHTLSHANFLRSVADDQFAAMLEEERLALERVAEENFQEFKERCEGAAEDVEERVGWRIEELGEGLGERLEKEKEELMKGREELRLAKEELRRDVEEMRRDKRELRRETAELRREKKKLRKERKEFEIERREAMESRPAQPGRSVESVPP